MVTAADTWLARVAPAAATLPFDWCGAEGSMASTVDSDVIPSRAALGVEEDDTKDLSGVPDRI
ncbi:hypothetical protein [Microlunatus parietis]|uniref:Uncharacterized protein n=1 Tax=Microlunatus parietis TaxID=682979 RepID=A0A7Y9LGP6_9ACTN|nr:hypothetical protein [Microlunatus parietis]